MNCPQLPAQDHHQMEINGYILDLLNAQPSKQQSATMRKNKNQMKTKADQNMGTQIKAMVSQLSYFPNHPRNAHFSILTSDQIRKSVKNYYISNYKFFKLGLTSSYEGHKS